MSSFYSSGGLTNYIKSLYCKNFALPETDQLKTKVRAQLEKIQLYKSLRDNLFNRIQSRKGLKKSELLDLVDGQIKASFLEELVGHECFCDYKKATNAEKVSRVLQILEKNSFSLKKTDQFSSKGSSKHLSSCNECQNEITGSGLPTVMEVDEKLQESPNDKMRALMKLLSFKEQFLLEKSPTIEFEKLKELSPDNYNLKKESIESFGLGDADDDLAKANLIDPREDLRAYKFNKAEETIWFKIEEKIRD
jgi:hypothetical protein